MSGCPFTGNPVINKIPWVGEARPHPEDKDKVLEWARLEARREIIKLRRELETLRRQASPLISSPI